MYAVVYAIFAVAGIILLSELPRTRDAASERRP